MTVPTTVPHRAETTPTATVPTTLRESARSGTQFGTVIKIIGDGLDHCPECWLDQLPNTAAQPIALLPRKHTTWVTARYHCPDCGHGWWRPWPRAVNLPDPPERKKSNKRSRS